MVVLTYGAATGACFPGSGVGWLRSSFHWFRVAAVAYGLFLCFYCKIWGDVWPIGCGLCPIRFGLRLLRFFGWFLANRGLGLGFGIESLYLMLSPCSF